MNLNSTYKVKSTRIFKVLSAIVILMLSFSGPSQAQKNPETNNDFVVLDKLSALKKHINRDNVHVKLLPGNYQIDEADCIRFLQFTGNNSYFDLTGCRFMVDTKLFSRTDLKSAGDGNSLYCAIEISGHNVTLEGLYIETYGCQPGRQSKNKVFNLVGENITLKNVEVRTAGSHPWGYGALYGIGGGSGVRKMNGIRVGYPAKNVKLIGCKVHMRAMGHAIFLQGAENTVIEDCHVDGLLRTTDAILAETSGFCFEKDFYAHKGGYIEGTTVADDGKILPGEMISLSEDGIRLYPEYNGHPTKNTIIKDCTVFQMRRGICTGLNRFGDKVINCRAERCVAAGFNVGNQDTLINCSADALFAEAVCIPYSKSKNAYVEMTILDSRNGMANNLLAVINGRGHHVVLTTANPAFIPANLKIELATGHGYAYYQLPDVAASEVIVENKTAAEVILYPNAHAALVTSIGNIKNISEK